MLFGWGKKQKSTPSTVEDMVLVSTWRYVHFLFIFQLAYKQIFELRGNDRSKDREIDKIKAFQIIHGPLPGPSLWQQWSLPGLFLVLLISGITASILGANGVSMEQKCTDTSNPDYSTSQCSNYRFDQSVRSLKQGNGYGY